MMLPALDRLGPYELIKNLTRPGRAEVYLGRMAVERDPEGTGSGKDLPEFAVIKVLRPPPNIDPALQSRVQEAMARFVEEGRLGARIRHPNITRTYGVALDRRLNLHFIIQEFIEGITLSQVLDHCASRERPLPFSVVLRLVIPLLKALHYAHHDALREDGRPLRVIHRDIKPTNAMLAYDGRVMLLDLAAAKSTSFTRQDTVQDVVMGTSHYLAPEQVFDLDKVSHQTDIFATGVILYELATLRPLLPRTRKLSEIAAALGRFNFTDHAPNVNEAQYPGLKAVLAQALASDPEQRFRTAGEMARLLDGLLMQAGDSPGLPNFAAELRREWDSGNAGGSDRVEERPRTLNTGRGRSNLAETPRTSDSQRSDPSPAASPAMPSGAHAPPYHVVSSAEPEKESRMWSTSDVVWAVLITFVVASLTWMALAVFW